MLIMAQQFRRALQTPQILELSGIGDKQIIETLGIKTVVNLPGVGANMQEHSFVSLVLGMYPSVFVIVSVYLFVF